MSLRELYQEMILDHGKAPRHFGYLEQASHTKVGHNPICGDKLIFYSIIKEDVILDIRFQGEGCAIAIASASLMCETIYNKQVRVFETLFNHFHHLVTDGNVTVDMGKLAVFSGIREFPIRVKCATLAWHTLQAALTNNEKIVSTELS